MSSLVAPRGNGAQVLGVAPTQNMSAAAWETALSLLGTSVQYYSLRKSLQQQHKLHEHETALTTEQHFTSLAIICRLSCHTAAHARRSRWSH